MKNEDFGELTLMARIAFAIMCFERYALSIYPNINFKPAAEKMWHIVDGSDYVDEASYKMYEMLPETLGRGERAINGWAITLTGKLCQSSYKVSMRKAAALRQPPSFGVLLSYSLPALTVWQDCGTIKVRKNFIETDVRFPCKQRLYVQEVMQTCRTNRS